MQPCLDFNGDALIPPILPCQGVVNGDCSFACTSVQSLIRSVEPNNLATCGLWALMVNVCSRSPQRMHNDGLEAFVPLGLDYQNATYASTATKAVSAVLSAFYLRTSSSTSGYDERIPLFCSEQQLFPLFTQESPLYDIDRFRTYSGANSNAVLPLWYCVEKICSPRSLDPDLGGIGVGHAQCLSRRPADFSRSTRLCYSR